jgi:glycine dehydrogenase subunit 1
VKYLPNCGEELHKILKTIGVKSIEELFNSIPEELRLTKPLDLLDPKSEMEVLEELKNLAAKNKTASNCSFFLGAGAYHHYIPTVVSSLISRSEFYTAYTPYQPEVSQGTLQALFEYQTMICQLTEMEVANSSLYDGASGTAEAVLMADRVQKKRKKIIISEGLHPEYQETIETYLHNLPLEIIKIALTDEKGETDTDALEKAVDQNTAAVLVQSPNFFGLIEPLDIISEITKKSGAIFIVSIAEIYSLGLLRGPGAFDADIVVGEAQSLGNRMNYGGPYLGFIATRDKFKRQLPGRLVGMTKDNKEQRGFVITLSTREQHIRREKATSNICTNEALCATMAAIHMATLGEKGIRETANACYSKSEYAKEAIKSINKISIPYVGSGFNEFVIDIGKNAKEVVESLAKKDIIAGFPLVYYYPDRENQLLVAFTEMNHKNEIDNFVKALEGEL